VSSDDGSVDVVVVAYASEDLIARSVGSVIDLDEVRSVVVIDNGDGRSAKVAVALGVRTLLRPDNPGFGAGQNTGAAVGTAPFLLLLNPDAALEPGALAAGLAALRDHSVGAVQGVVASDASGEPERAAGRELGAVHLLGRALSARALLRSRVVRLLARRVPSFRDHVERVPTAAEDVETLAAVSILVRRDAFEGIGGFDERYFLYGEDLDLCRRLRGAGWRLVSLPVAWASQHSGASASAWWDRELRWWEGTMQFASQWWGTGAFLGALSAGGVMWVRLGVTRPRSAGVALRALIGRPMRLRQRRT
jgi:N-acetylglucosaminyl-diphospho-decaprenol L-rhamnosyltransferase